MESLNGSRGAIAPAPTREEAAAIIAAVERFMRATAPPPAEPGADALDPWTRTAIVEGVARDVEADLHDPWINA